MVAIHSPSAEHEWAPAARAPLPAPPPAPRAVPVERRHRLPDRATCVRAAGWRCSWWRSPWWAC